jgi:hypothetical protein
MLGRLRATISGEGWRKSHTNRGRRHATNHIEGHGITKKRRKTTNMSPWKRRCVASYFHSVGWPEISMSLTRVDGWGLQVNSAPAGQSYMATKCPNFMDHAMKWVLHKYPPFSIPSRLKRKHELKSLHVLEIYWEQIV